MSAKEIVDRCRELAARLHNRDTPPREDSGLAYITHPARVVALLEQWGFADDPLAISLGWTHDLKEDTKATDEEIRTAALELGDELLAGVNRLTFNDTSVDHDQAKSEYIESVAMAGGIPLAVKIADRICNSLERAETSPSRALAYFVKGQPLFCRAASLPHGEEIITSIIKAGYCLVSKQ